MRLFPLVFAFEKDIDLVLAQRQLMRRIPWSFAEHTIVVEPSFAPTVHRAALMESGVRILYRPEGYSPWGTWKHCLSKLGGYKNALEALDPADEDYILDLDSDAFLLNDRLLRYLGEAEFVGIRYDNRFQWVERFRRDWTHVFGAFMAIKGSALRRVAALSPGDLAWAQSYLSTSGHFSMVNEQFVSLLMELAGATGLYPPNYDLFSEGPPVEPLLLAGGKGFGLTHFYGQWPQFAGYPVDGKYDIPRVMRAIGLL